MKELSIEDKAKLYEQAFLRAKKLKETCDSNAVVGWMEYIFPELAESEDERIRKALINHFRCVAKNGDTVWTNLDYDKVIAWLEKQGEQKPVDSTFEIKPKFKVGDTIRELETGNLFYVNSIEDFGYTLHYKNCNANGCTMSFKYEDNYELVEQKPAWSEDDEEIIEALISLCDEAQDNIPQLSALKNWLKNLKDRVQPQNRWKPSEGQLECLGYAIDKAEKDWSPLTNNRIYLTLKALKEQLLELKGSKV